jgi:hypothetical protein
MTRKKEFDRIIGEMRYEQRIRDNASSLYATVIFCKWHLMQTHWESEEYRLESADTALNLCNAVLDRANGVTA